MQRSVKRQDYLARMPWIDREEADIEHYCRNHSEDLFDLRHALQSWQTDGVVIFPGAIPEATLQSFDRELEKLIDSPQDFHQEVKVGAVSKHTAQCCVEELRQCPNLRFNNIHYISPAARALGLAPAVVRFLQHVFQETPCTMQTLTFNRGSQQPAHADFAFVYNQKDIAFLAASWIPLENVHPDSGPLAYYPGTHNVVKFGFYDFGEGEIIMTDGTNLMSATEFGVWLNEEIARGKYPRRVFLPKRGDVLIWHAALVHEGSQIANKALTRKSVVTHYSAFSQMPDTHIIRDAAGKPKLFMVNGGAVFQHPWVDYARQL
jgi:phytanoyl-CoA hydroxylase